MKKLYILLTKSDTYISRLISIVKSDKYTHAAISFVENLTPLYSFSRKLVHFPLPAGLRIEPLRSGFYKKYHYIPCALFELEVSDEIFNKAKSEVDSMMTVAEKYKFNVIGLFSCGFQISVKRRKKYFCSEFVSEILKRSNALELPKIPSLMRPNDYAQLPELNCIFEGKLNELLEKEEFLSY